MKHIRKLAVRVLLFFLGMIVLLGGCSVETGRQWSIREVGESWDVVELDNNEYGVMPEVYQNSLTVLNAPPLLRYTRLSMPPYFKFYFSICTDDKLKTLCVTSLQAKTSKGDTLKLIDNPVNLPLVKSRYNTNANRDVWQTVANVQGHDLPYDIVEVNLTGTVHTLNGDLVLALCRQFSIKNEWRVGVIPGWWQWFYLDCL